MAKPLGYEAASALVYLLIFTDLPFKDDDGTKHRLALGAVGRLQTSWEIFPSISRLGTPCHCGHSEDN